MNRRRKNYMIAAIGLAICTVVILLVLLTSNHKSKSTSDEVAAGISYVQAHDTDDISEVEETLRLQKQQKIQEQCEQMIAKIEEDGSNVWSMFDDYLLMGDSRAVGFYYYKFLPEDNVWAESGANLRKHLEEHLEEIYERAPGNLYFCYGINDVGIWDSPEEYAAEFKDVCEQIHENLPDTKIFISSILLAHDNSSKWRKIPDFNVSLEEMCQELSYVYFVDNNEICDTYADMYAPDGIHLNPSFYPYWGTNLIVETLKSELTSDDTFSSSADSTSDEGTVSSDTDESSSDSDESSDASNESSSDSDESSSDSN